MKLKDQIEELTKRVEKLERERVVIINNHQPLQPVKPNPYIPPSIPDTGTPFNPPWNGTC